MSPLKVLIYISASFVIGGCAVPHYKPVNLPQPIASASHSELKVVIFFKPVLEGQRVDQTVWDNAVGPTVSVPESKQIGFTQNYSLPVAAFAPQPVAVGLFASGQASVIKSRIMIPFGALISFQAQVLADSSFSSTTICFDTNCFDQAKASSPDRIAVVTLDKLAVAETTSNHLSMAMTGSVKVSKAPDLSAVGITTIDERLTDRSIMSHGLFYGNYVDTINEIANDFTQAVAKDIVSAMK